MQTTATKTIKRRTAEHAAHLRDALNSGRLSLRQEDRLRIEARRAAVAASLQAQEGK